MSAIIAMAVISCVILGLAGGVPAVPGITGRFGELTSTADTHYPSSGGRAEYLPALVLGVMMMLAGVYLQRRQNRS